VTDARFPERWLNDRRVLRLPDNAFRLFVLSLAWSVANKTDGYLSDEDLALIPGVNLEAAKALYDAELWWGHMHGAQITEFEETQTTSDDLEVLARGRRAQRDKKRRQRAAKAAGAVPGTVPGDVSRDTPRPGQARPGQAPRPEVRSKAGPEIASEAAGREAAGRDKNPAGSSHRRHAGGAGVPAGGLANPSPFPTPGNDDGPGQLPPVERNLTNGVQLQSPATAPIAREDRRLACPVCGVRQGLRVNGKIRRHGPQDAPCPGSGRPVSQATA
jgi:hypothetical protein